ncbi:MAG: LLM class flavin-dependent oxidoreductase [Pseudorhodoplanes sp.]
MPKVGESVGVEWGWYTPLDGDGRHVGTYDPEIHPTIEHLTGVAKAAEAAGFHLILIPTSLVNSAYGETGPRADPVSTACAIALATKRIRMLLAFKIGEIHPAYLAKLCTSIDRMSGGRLSLNITSGGGSVEARFGEKLDHDARLRRTKEVVGILKDLWTKDKVDVSGEFYELSQVFSYPKPLQKPHPPLYGVGQSELAKELTAAECEAHLMQCNTAPILREQLEDVRARARRRGRNVRFGMRAQVVVRASEKEAWEAVREMLSQVDPRVVASRREQRVGSDATEVRRLIGDALEANLIAPNVWNGMHAVKAGAGTVLIGTPEQLAERCVEYIEAGVSGFIFSGYPHDEEATRVGKMLLPVAEEMIAARPHMRERLLELTAKAAPGVVSGAA